MRVLTGVAGSDTGALVQRERELGLIEQQLREAHDGRGGALLLLGSAGLGKTALLRCMARLAREAGLEVLTARGSELEHDLPFGVARQLLELPVRELAASPRRAVLGGAAAHAKPVLGVAGESGDALAVTHGLYWLCANLADRSPLALVVDDVQWADEQSVRWLCYLAPRIADVPVALALAARPSDLPAALAAESILVTVELSALDRAGVGQIIERQFGAPGDTQFVAACHHATGGNPFFAQELARAARSDGIEPVAAEAESLSKLGSREITRSILVRLGQLGQEARRLAEAAAVLGPGAELRYAATLSGMPIERALGVWDTLAEAEIVEPSQPLEFVHPIARIAVYESLAPGERSAAHRRAAALLAQADASAERICAHALMCVPAADQHVVAWLRDGARRALASSAPEAAARLLLRALEEPPLAEASQELDMELGQALMGFDNDAAAASFAQAASGPSEKWRLPAERWLGHSLALAGHLAESVAAFDRAIELAGDDTETVLHLIGSRDQFALWMAEDPFRGVRRRELHERAAVLTGDTPGERRLLASAALSVVHSGAMPVAASLELARRGGAGARLTDPEGFEAAGAANTVRVLGDDPAALDAYLAAADEFTACGSLVLAAWSRFVLTTIRFRRGELVDSEADARIGLQALERLPPPGTVVYAWSAAAFAQTLLARGALDEAAELIEPMSGKPLPVVIFPSPDVLAAQLALTRGRIEEGIATLLRAGEWLEQRGFTNPALVEWRAILAPALASVGRMDEARATVAVAVDRARAFGSPWALGATLRAAGTVEGGARGVELLSEAISVLESSPCRLEHAHALLELGASLRRANQRVGARPHLRAALQLATQCGALPLASRAREELAATGARPRRVMLTGLDSLTASERRVAELAAAGRSNPEIAQALFVTRKTIETHLGSVFRKLDISSREQLAGALSAG